jgi:predicted ArsR family transcriptional regulator
MPVNPVTEPLTAVGDPALREVLLFVRAQPGPQSADDVADALGLHRNVARSRLERLTGAGLLLAAYERRTGRDGPGAGRPAKVYAAAPELRALEFPPRHYEQLVAELIEAVPERGRAARLEETGAAFARQLGQSAALRAGRDLAGAAAEVCAALGRLGYQARVVEVTENEAVVSTPTCPLRPLVNASEGAVGLDRGFWAGLVEASLPGEPAACVECRTGGCRDEHASCEIRLRLQPAK